MNLELYREFLINLAWSLNRALKELERDQESDSEPERSRKITLCQTDWGCDSLSSWRSQKFRYFSVSNKYFLRVREKPIPIKTHLHNLKRDIKSFSQTILHVEKCQPLAERKTDSKQSPIKVSLYLFNFDVNIWLIRELVITISNRYGWMFSNITSTQNNRGESLASTGLNPLSV